MPPEESKSDPPRAETGQFAIAKKVAFIQICEILNKVQKEHREPILNAVCVLFETK